MPMMSDPLNEFAQEMAPVLAEVYPMTPEPIRRPGVFVAAKKAEGVDVRGNLISTMLIAGVMMAATGDFSEAESAAAAEEAISFSSILPQGLIKTVLKGIRRTAGLDRRSKKTMRSLIDYCTKPVPRGKYRCILCVGNSIGAMEMETPPKTPPPADPSRN